jgi:hypothetical protein
MFATGQEIVYISYLSCDQDRATKELFAMVRISHILAELDI